MSRATNTPSMPVPNTSSKLEQQQLLFLDRIPAYEHGNDQQQRRQREEPKTQAIQGDAELDIQRNARHHVRMVGGKPGVIAGRERQRDAGGVKDPSGELRDQHDCE